MIVLWKHNEKDEWINADTDELIDAYESIVRCKDCRFEQYCKYTQHLGMDGYCSRGERKGGAE